MSKLDVLTGKKFQRLLVLDNYYRKNNRTYWTCQCDCGNIIDVYAGHLKNGHTKSCGCLKRDLAKEHMTKLSTNNFKDITGKTFGFLIPFQKTIERQDGSVVWKCKCTNCGTICLANEHALSRGDKISCGCIKSKGENKIKKILLDNNISFIQQKTFDSCRFLDTNSLAFFDFYIENKYLVEYDGDVHFNHTRGWNTKENFEKIRQRDAFKNSWCKEHNIPLIRIPYTQYEKLCIEDLLLETSNFII